MIRHIFTVSSGTLASRLLGFARDAMIAALLGAGPIADAFLAAFQLVTVIRRLLSEGALNAALVPAWLDVHARNGAAAAAAFAGGVLGSISVAVACAAALLGVAMPLVISALAPGFGGETLQLAVHDARLMLPYLAFAGPVTVMMALLNAQHRFTLSAFSPVLLNIALIVVMAGLLLRRTDPSDAAFVVAATVGVAGLLQLAMLAISGRAGDLARPLRVSFDTQMRGLFARAIPGMIALAGPQLLIVGGAIVASTTPSAVSWLYFANRLIDLPLGIVGAATGTVLVPELTRAVRSEDKVALREAESRGLELAAGLALPATLGLIVLAQPIVSVLFEHGAFTAADTQATALALALLALGLPAQVLVKTLSPAFFARGDTMTPLLATLKALAVTIVLAIVFGHIFGVNGIAAAIAMGAWNCAFHLVRSGAATFGFAIDADARRRLPRIALAALAMGGLLWLKMRYVWPLVVEAQNLDIHGLPQAFTLGLLIAGGIVIYGGLLLLLGVIDIRAIRQRLRG